MSLAIKNILGNERADMGAKFAHGLSHITPVPVAALDLLRTFRHKLSSHRQTEWENAVLCTNKGFFLKRIKPVLSHWPWASSSSRKVESVMAKLRVGHANVAQRMYRIQKKDTPQCWFCVSVETIDHFLLSCPHYVSERLILQSTLHSLNVPFTLINLLGGGPYDSSIQSLIVSAVAVFLFDSGRLGTL